MSAAPVPASGLCAPPSTGKLMRFTGWNLFGLCAPMAVAFFALPPLRARMGHEIYGAFIFLLTVVNYLTILDLGLGRATTRFIAVRLAGGKEEDLPGIFWTAQGMMLAFGLAGAALFMPLITPIVCRWNSFRPDLMADACNTLFAAAAATPFLVVTASLVGTLEAHQKFRRISLIRVPMQIYTFVGPLAVAMMTHTLFAPVLALLLGKIVECLIYFAACLAVVPALRRGITFKPGLVRDLFRFGGWMSVSSIAMLVMAQSNSALMIGLLGVAEVGLYGTIAEMVIRLLVFPRAWVSVLFPSFSAQHAVSREAVSALYVKGVKILLVATFPVMLLLVAFAGEGLAVWQDWEFAVATAGVMRWLVAGVFVYSLSYVPFSLLQGVGRPDLSARLHLVMVPLYLVLAWVLMKECGMEGAGMAWFIRCAVEAAMMFARAHPFAPGSGRHVARAAGLTAVALLMLGVVTLVSTLTAGPVLALVGLTVLGELAVFAALAWYWLLGADERRQVTDWVRRLRSE